MQSRREMSLRPSLSGDDRHSSPTRTRIGDNVKDSSAIAKLTKTRGNSVQKSDMEIKKYLF